MALENRIWYWFVHKGKKNISTEVRYLIYSKEFHFFFYLESFSLFCVVLFLIIYQITSSLPFNIPNPFRPILRIILVLFSFLHILFHNSQISSIDAVFFLSIGFVDVSIFFFYTKHFTYKMYFFSPISPSFFLFCEIYVAYLVHLFLYHFTCFK